MLHTLCRRRRKGTWVAACRRAMDTLVGDGLARSVGVSYFF